MEKVNCLERNPAVEKYYSEMSNEQKLAEIDDSLKSAVKIVRNLEKQKAKVLIDDNIEIKDLIKELLPIVEDVVGGMSCFPNHSETQKEKHRFEELILKLKLFLK